MNIRFLFIISTCFLTTTLTGQLEYPAIYKSLDLPEYENASVVDLGRQQASLRDGLKLSLETQVDYATLRSYYETELSSKGWILEETIATQKMREAGMLDQMPFAGVFSKGNKRCQIFSYKEETTTKYTISVVED